MTYIDYLNDFNQWLETNPLPASSQLMYFKLLNIFNRAGWPEEVGVDNLRLQMMLDGAAKTTVVRARDKLVEAGFIAYKKGRKGFPNRYALIRKVSIFDTESATVSATENATVSATINATHIKTKTKNKNTPPTPPGGKAVSEPKYKPEWFDRFWALYPRHTARAAAVKAWDKLKPDLELCRVMADAIRAQIKSPQWQEGPEHIPHPSTWLNGARWQDEMPNKSSGGSLPEPEVRNGVR